MDFFTAITAAAIAGVAACLGLTFAGREIRAGLVEAAKVRQGQDTPTPKTWD